MPSLPPKDINVNKTFSKAVGDMRGLSINKTSSRFKSSCISLFSQLYSPPTKLVSDDDVIIESSKIRTNTTATNVYEAPTSNNLINDYHLNHPKTMIFEKPVAITASNYINNKNNIISTATGVNVDINDCIKQQPSISTTVTCAKIPQIKNAELAKSLYWNNLAAGQIDDNNNNIYDLQQNSLHHPDNLYYPQLPPPALNHLSTNNTVNTAAFTDGSNIDVLYDDKLNGIKDVIPHKHSSIYSTFYNTDINNTKDSCYLFNPLTLSFDEVSPDLTSGSETSSLGSSPPKEDDDYRRSLLFSASNNDKNNISSITNNTTSFAPFDEYNNVTTAATTFVSTLSKNEVTNTNFDLPKSPVTNFDSALCPLHKENTEHELDGDNKIPCVLDPFDIIEATTDTTNNDDDNSEEFRKSLLLSALNNTVFLPSSSSNNSTNSPSHGDNFSTSSTNKGINKESSDLLVSESTTQNLSSHEEDLHLLSQKYNINNHDSEYEISNSATLPTTQFKDNNISTTSKPVSSNNVIVQSSSKPAVNQKVIENLSNISTAVALANIKSTTTTTPAFNDNIDNTMPTNIITANPKARRNSDPVKSMSSSVASSVTDDKDQKKTILYKTEICRNWEEKVSSDDNNGNNISNTGSSRKSGGMTNKQRLSKFISDPSIYGSYNNGSASKNTNTAGTGTNEPSSLTLSILKDLEVEGDLSLDNIINHPATIRERSLSLCGTGGSHAKPLNNTVFLPSRGDNSFTSSTNKGINEESSDLNPPLKIYLLTDDNKDQKKTFSFYKTEMCRSLEDKDMETDSNSHIL
ncbi:6653_t:CDS:2 [Entrophospora sp. SA101]|nr:6650_t:CDS:2 [Entrophospora sp. SA101]CAJ0906142.1 6653_t:CDS:2 [Entrophospora sp. SA101]